MYKHTKQSGHCQWHRHFDSVNDAVNAFTEGMNANMHKGQNADASSVERAKQVHAGDKFTDRFAFGRSVESTAAFDALLTGRANKDAQRAFEEAYNQQRKHLTNIDCDVVASAKPGERRKQFVRGGGQVHVGRYLAGMDDHFARRRRTSFRPTFKLGVSLSVSAMVDAIELSRTMGKALAVAEHVESCGFAVEIEASFQSKDAPVLGRKRKKIRHSQTITIKHAGKPLDRQAMLSAGNPALFRVIMFALWEDTRGTECIDASTALGRPDAIEAHHPDRYDIIMPTECGVWKADGLTKLLSKKAI
jgi:hypothetical protein